jgi:hypothetical protein
MDVSVYTYNHPRQWHQHNQFDAIKNEIHICATKNMVAGIKECYRNDKKQEFQYIFTIRQVMNRMFGEWNRPESQLQQYLTLSKVINEATLGNQSLRDAFRNNTTEVLDTIRFLVYTGIKPEDLKLPMGLTKKETFFHDIWEKAEKEDTSYSNFRSNFNKKWHQADIVQVLNRILKNQYEEGLEDLLLEIPLNHTKLVLHGFYFITPEQQRFLKLLQRAGFEIIFFNYYDERFPNTFDFTKAFISKRFQWTDSWFIQEENTMPLESSGAAFLHSFENGKSIKHPEKKKIIAYDSFFDFLHQVIIKHYPIGEKREYPNGKDFQLIATNADILNEILVQYYPEDFADKRNFLNYPAGQFIMKIHEMLQGGRIHLNEEILMATFSSGWLFDKKTIQNGRDYTHALQQLFPFFAGCTTLDKWIERIDELVVQYNQILPLFEGPADNRVLESIRSPFAKIAYLSLEKAKVEQIREFFILLEEMATDLFVLSTDTVSLKEHFERLEKLMKEHNPIQHTVLQNEEKRLIEKLNYKISLIEDDHQFLYEDLEKAMNFYLSGKFSDDEETFIKPFIEVDGEAFKNNNRQIYLTGLDEQGLPLSEFTTPWPLLDSTFDELSKKHQVLELNSLRNKSVKSISRYLLFIAMEFLAVDKLELSWICNFLDRVDLQPAVYVHYLDMKIENHKFEINPGTKTRSNLFDFTQYSHSEDKLQQAFNELKYEDILAEYELCPRRFYYGFVLDRHPVFTEEFMHQFIFSELVKLVKRDTRKPDEEVIQFVSDLFPQWSDFRKETIAQKSLSYRISSKNKQELIMENFSVSETRKNFQFPGLKNKDRQKLFEDVHQRKNEIMRALKEPNEENALKLEAKSGYNCRFCPHQDWCTDVVYGVDRTVSQK